MTLREQQSKFAKMAAELILKAYELGYEVTLGDAYRDPRLHGEFGVKRRMVRLNRFINCV